MVVLRVGAEEFRRRLTELLSRAGYGDDQVIVERHGTPLAVLIPYRTYTLLSPAGPSDSAETVHAPVEQVPNLAAEIETERQATGISYQELAQQFQAERLRTLQEKYPEFYRQIVSCSF